MKISARLALFAIVAIVATLAYLGLAVWGLGGFLRRFYPMAAGGRGAGNRKRRYIQH